jgi:hypothetical protein
MTNPKQEMIVNDEKSEKVRVKAALPQLRHRRREGRQHTGRSRRRGIGGATFSVRENKRERYWS